MIVIPKDPNFKGPPPVQITFMNSLYRLHLSGEDNLCVQFLFVTGGIKIVALLEGLAGKALGYTASFVSDTVSEKFYQIGDHFYSFGANWGVTDARNWFSGKTESFLALNDRKTAALVVASPAIGLVAFRILTGGLGCGAKGLSKAAEFVGYNHLKQPFERMGDDLISFATKKIETDLKVGAALTGVAAAVLMLKD